MMNGSQILFENFLTEELSKHVCQLDKIFITGNITSEDLCRMF